VCVICATIWQHSSWYRASRGSLGNRWASFYAHGCKRFVDRYPDELWRQPIHDGGATVADEYVGRTSWGAAALVPAARRRAGVRGNVGRRSKTVQSRPTTRPSTSRPQPRFTAEERSRTPSRARRRLRYTDTKQGSAVGAIDVDEWLTFEGHHQVRRSVSYQNGPRISNTTCQPPWYQWYCKIQRFPNIALLNLAYPQLNNFSTLLNIFIL